MSAPFNTVQQIEQQIHQLESQISVNLGPEDELKKLKDQLRKEKYNYQLITAGKIVHSFVDKLYADKQAKSHRMDEITFQINLAKLIEKMRLIKMATKMTLSMFFIDNSTFNPEAVTILSDIDRLFDLFINEFSDIDKYVSSCAQIMLEHPDSPHGKVLEEHFKKQFNTNLSALNEQKISNCNEEEDAD